MQRNRLARKLNNKSGNSIMMALLLLLVATVVSIVIVTVALTSTMHVDDNRTSQQEYLACVSAAEMLRDGLDGSTYKNVHKTYEKQSYWNSDKDPVDDPTNTPKNSQFKKFVKSISSTILNHEYTSTDKNTIMVAEKAFTVTVTDTESATVNAYVKLVCTGENEYELRFKFAVAEANSEGYRMSMVMPVNRTVEGPKNAGSETGEYFPWYTYTVYKTTTTITWGGSGANTKISKGWGAYES